MCVVKLKTYVGNKNDMTYFRGEKNYFLVLFKETIKTMKLLKPTKLIQCLETSNLI